MSYSGRHSVNASAFISQLNQVSPQEEALDSPQGLDDELALFNGTNEFVNWDGPSALDLNPAPFDMHFEQPAAAPAAQPAIDFDFAGPFDFTDFNAFPAAPLVDQQLPNLSHQQPHAQANAYPLAHPPFAAPTPGGASLVSPVSQTFDASSAAKKRKHSTLLDASAHIHDAHLDEAARQAAEEDKRRRNTAASARFRIKKKQREQALEKTAKEMTDKVAMLEARLQQVETENAWLKSLITEKNGGKLSAEHLGLLKKQLEERSKGGVRVEGVGTGAETETKKGEEVST